MKIETLKDRINKAEEKIEKLNKTLERHQKTLDKKVTILIKKGIDMNNYNKFDTNIRNTDIYQELCAYENKLKNIEDTKVKLSDVKMKLHKYQKQLEDQLSTELKINNMIPECLNVFLEKYKQKSLEFYINLANTYLDMEFKEYEVTREELELLEKYSFHYNTMTKMYNEDEINNILMQDKDSYLYQNAKREIHDRHFTNFKKTLFTSDLMIIKKIIGYDAINKNTLNKILDDDVKNKKEQFINRIYEVIGNIVDMSDLKIGQNGEINGIAKGEKANAKVETISAGGYNVQCYHFRVLVNTIK